MSSRKGAFRMWRLRISWNDLSDLWKTTIIVVAATVIVAPIVTYFLGLWHPFAPGPTPTRLPTTAASATTPAIVIYNQRASLKRINKRQTLFVNIYYRNTTPTQYAGQTNYTFTFGSSANSASISRLTQKMASATRELETAEPTNVMPYGDEFTTVPPRVRYLSPEELSGFTSGKLAFYYAGEIVVTTGSVSLTFPYCGYVLDTFGALVIHRCAA